MRVLKFGGTSVGTAQSLLNVKHIVQDACNVVDSVIVVVSALGGVTDQLIRISQLAAAGDEAYKSELLSLVARHHDVIASVVAKDEQSEARHRVDAMLNELDNIFQGICLVKDMSSRTADLIVSYGERMSAVIAASLVGAQLIDSREFIKTEHKQGKNLLDAELTGKLVRGRFATLPRLALAPGFIAADKDTGNVTNLGRGGSDYTAAILAAELNAERLEIWTDVDGFMTADPRVIPNAYTIPELSYVEATELCNFGAKVIYPPTIYPVYHKNIPILVKNTFHPTAQGTIIKSGAKQDDDGKVIKGISSIANSSLITVQGLGMVGVIGVNKRIFKALADAGISVFLVSQASSENSTSIGVRETDAQAACDALNEEFGREIGMGKISPIKPETGLATIAIVGEGMRHSPGVAGKLFLTLGRSGISVVACAQGASETNISLVIDRRQLRKALGVIHDSFFLSQYQVLNIFVCGIGTVGSSLLEQINAQRDKLKIENGLQLNVAGVANSKQALLVADGVDLRDYRRQLQDQGQASSPTALRDAIEGMNMYNTVFVDCTASPAIAALYNDLLSRNISVVAANKIAASSSYDNYERLKRTAHQRGVKFLFETNVGAGLPIINTINDLRHSGDKILKIEAVLSGTLNYVFNSLSASVRLSQAVRMAKEAGYSEPDPRIDLSGIDVVRKLVILGREAGYRLEQTDVERRPFLPAAMLEGTLEGFWAQLPSLDAEFEVRRKKLEQEGKRLRYVARLEGGKATVGLEEVWQNHPFYGLESSNNSIMLTTERYKEYPMVIQGYGAGASVTAAGVFADIMSIANV